MLTLALGIGSAVVTVDVLDRLLLRMPEHVSDPERVTRVYVGMGGRTYVDRMGYATFDALGTMHDEVETSAVYFSESLTLGRGPNARRMEVIAHSRDYFSVLGVQPFLGSWIEASGAPRDDTAVISYGLWQREFGGARDVLGKPLRLGLDTYSVVAVAPRGFAGVDFKATDIWLPLVPRAKATYGAEWKAMPFFLQAIARLRPGVSRDRATERATVAYRAAHVQAWEPTSALVMGDLRPARAPGVRVGARVEVLVAGMSILVLFITCGNVANLLLVRGLRRQREFLVKTALGATRGRLLREVLLEAALLAAGAGVLALAVVMTGGTLMRRQFLSPVAALASPLDARVLMITIGFCAAAAFLFGLSPAFHLTARRALTPGHAVVGRPSRVLDLFCGLQVALSLPMIVAAVVFMLSLWNARHQDFGMQSDRVAIVTTNLFELGRPWENHAAHRLIQARVAGLPQVESTALVEHVPAFTWTMMSITIDVPESDIFKGTFDAADLPSSNGVDPSFFTLMRMRLIQGRLFTDEENRKGARPVAVITDSMARHIWPGQVPLGKCFYIGGRGKGTPCTEVVGVVTDAQMLPSVRPTKQGASIYYVPINQADHTVSDRALLVRTTGDPAKVLDMLRRESGAAAAYLPYVDAHAFDDVFEAMLRPWRLGSTVFMIFGALSIVIAAVGLAAISAYAVTRRTREIGIRSALGAQPRDLVRLMLRHGMLVVVAGLSVGLGLAWASAGIISAQLFDVAAREPSVFAAAALGMLAVGTLAVWLPARRAARIDALIALRTE
jgi:predicted permease